MSDYPSTTESVGTPKEGAARSAPASLLVFLVFIELTSGFVQGFYTPLLPDLAQYLGVSGEAMNWFQTAQAMAAAVMVPLMSRMGDIFGARKALRVAIALVLVGTLITAVVPSYPAVLVGRVLVGPLGVWLPLLIAVIYVRTSGASLTRSISIVSASLMAGVVLGTIVAGISEQLFSSLPVALLLPSILVALSLLAALFRLPADIGLVPGKIDWVGFAGLGAIMVAFILALALMGPTHGTEALIVAVGAIFVATGWVWWEKKSSDPAVDFQIVFSKATGPLYVSAFVLGIVMIDAAPNLADFLSRDPAVFGYGFGASSEVLAAMIAVMLLCATVGAFLSSFIAAAVGMRRMLVTAAVAGLVGQVLLVTFPHHLPTFWISGILTGAGLGVLVGTLPALVAKAAPEGRTGIANGLYAALLAMGGAFGGALFKQLLVAFRDENRIAVIQGYMTIWGLTAAAFLVAVVMMATVKLPSSVHGAKTATETT